MNMISEASSTTTNSSTPSCLKRSGISLDWSLEEQAILEDGLVRFASFRSPLCYAKIASQLNNKTVRDVVSRAVWFKNKKEKERNKRTKQDHNASFGKFKVDNKVTIPNCYASSPLFKEEYESFMKIVEDNERLLKQIEANFKSKTILQNLILFPQCCANIDKLLLINNNENVPDQMKCLPPLPERLSDELIEAINSMLFC